MELSFIQMLAGLHPVVPVVLSILGILVVVGQVVVVMTPSKKDDEALEKAHGIPVLGGVLKAIAAFAPVQKK